MATGIRVVMHRTNTAPARRTVDVRTAMARIAEARADRLLSASEAMIAQSSVVVCSVFGPGRFAPETVRLREHILGRCGLSLSSVAANPYEAAAAHDRAFAPRPPKIRRRGSARLQLVAS
jgi:hypothetical protein